MKREELEESLFFGGLAIYGLLLPKWITHANMASAIGHSELEKKIKGQGIDREMSWGFLVVIGGKKGRYL